MRQLKGRSVYANEQVLREALTAILTGDEAGRNKVIAENIVTHVGGHSKLTGDWVGRGAVARRINELTGGRLQLEVLDVMASAADHACGLYRMRVTCPGEEPVEWGHVNVYRIQGGQIVEVWQHFLSKADQDRVDTFFG
jgi:ketosteroid isomerase-like protein